MVLFNLFFNFTQFVILENVSVLDFALSGLRGMLFFLGHYEATEYHDKRESGR